MTTDDRARMFEGLFETHVWAVRAYALRRAPAGVAEDVVSETFLVAWRRLESIDADPLPWLLGVARRLLANQLRSDRRRGALLSRLGGIGVPAPAFEAPEAMSPELAQALAALSPREREALLLVAWEGLDVARAARAAGCAAGTFRVRLHRARRRVAAALDPADDQAAQPSAAKEA
jgi:RNA polymerase sigma factor (sigma-70 family)